MCCALVVTLSNSRYVVYIVHLYPFLHLQSLSSTCGLFTIANNFQFGTWPVEIVKLRQGSGKDRQGMAVKAKGLKALTLA